MARLTRRQALRVMGVGTLGASGVGILAACGQAKTVTSAGAAVTGPSDSMAGTILADGSSTVGPVTQAVAEEFRKQFPEVRIPVGISGSGASGAALPALP